MTLSPLKLAALASLLAASCQVPQGYEDWVPTIGARAVAYSDTEFTVNSIVFQQTDSVDTTLNELTVGMTHTAPGEKRRLKKQLLSLSLGRGELEIDGGESNLTEFTLGSTWYFDNEQWYVPFLVAQGVLSDSAALSGLSNQGGARLGGGFEFPISSSTSISIGMDYLVPLYDAKTTAGDAEVDFDGIVGRVGFVFTL